MIFANIDPALLPAKPGKLSFFETICLAGLEDQWVRLSARDQRAMLGCVPFGKREINVSSADGSIRELGPRVCFGLDRDVFVMSPSELQLRVDNLMAALYHRA